MAKNKKTAWPADKVERWPLAKLIPYTRNVKTHSAEQIQQLADSIQEFGWTIPALVDEAGVLIAGHGRILAARKLGLSEVPVMIAAGWTEAQTRAYRIADNKLPEHSQWDPEALAEELRFLDGEKQIDPGVTGFDAAEIKLLIDAVPKIKERREDLRPKKFLRVLFSVPVDSAIDAKPIIDELSKVAGVEVDYGAN